MGGKKARAREKKSERRDANAANTAIAGEAFPRLPNHLVVTHILRSEHFDDDADLARLPAGEPRDARPGGRNGASA